MAAVTHPTLAPNRCDVELLQQLSKVKACVRNVSFGCVPDRRAMWVSKGCRGAFRLEHSVRGLLEETRMQCGVPAALDERHNCTVLRVDSCPCLDGEIHGLRCATCDAVVRVRQPTVIAMLFDWSPGSARGMDDPIRYLARADSLLRACASLALVNASVPIHVLLGGHHYPRFVAHLRALPRVHVHPIATVRATPSWARREYYSTFAKLLTLNLSYHLKSRVLYMDYDVFALRGLSRVLSTPAPAFVFYPNHAAGLNSGVFLVHVRTLRELERGWSALGDVPYGGLHDGSDQEFWLHYARSRSRPPAPRRPLEGDGVTADGLAPKGGVHELSRRHNLFQFEDLPQAGCWQPFKPCADDNATRAALAWFERVVLWHKPLEYKLWKYPPRMRTFVTAALDSIKRAYVQRGYMLRLPADVNLTRHAFRHDLRTVCAHGRCATLERALERRGLASRTGVVAARPRELPEEV